MQICRRVGSVPLELAGLCRYTDRTKGSPHSVRTAGPLCCEAPECWELR